MSLGKDQQIDQDALAAEWGLALEADGAGAQGEPKAEGEGGEGSEGGPQWSGMGGDGSDFMSGGKGGAERVLNQEEIDSLLGFSLTDISLNDNSGIRAIIDSAMVSYERLPMLEIVFDRLVRL
ncbi:MAG: flagellar motor switch protein FliM, partial [Xanthobacteraceae bacterium]|nr:flagellar motor switch protein FliM [Xanthobacteraceae bacterium]